MIPTKSCLVLRNSIDTDDGPVIISSTRVNISNESPSVSFTTNPQEISLSSSSQSNRIENDESLNNERIIDETNFDNDNNNIDNNVSLSSTASSTSTFQKKSQRTFASRSHSPSFNSSSSNNNDASNNFLPSALKQHSNNRPAYDTSGFVSGSSSGTQRHYAHYSLFESSCNNHAEPSIVRPRTSASVGYMKSLSHSRSPPPHLRRASVTCLCHGNSSPRSSHLSNCSTSEFMQINTSMELNGHNCCSHGPLGDESSPRYDDNRVDEFVNEEERDDSCCSPSHSLASLSLDGQNACEHLHTSCRHCCRRSCHSSSERHSRNCVVNPHVNCDVPLNAITIMVDNRRFYINACLLRAKPNTLLGKLFISSIESNHQWELSNTDLILPHAITRGLTAEMFAIVMEYYTKGCIHCPHHICVHQVKKVCEKLEIPFNYRSVRCSNLRAFLHEIANDGAKKIFDQFIEQELLHEMVKSAKMGERECHIVVLLDDDIVDWDLENPPQIPDNEINSQIVYSSPLNRFLKYAENRDIAKHVLQEKGLKKIRIGIEGYPTHKEKIKMRAGHRREVIYSFVQRPFFRMSWEEEENRSRHVDFQFVKSKSSNDLTGPGQQEQQQQQQQQQADEMDNDQNTFMDVPVSLSPPPPAAAAVFDIYSENSSVTRHVAMGDFSVF